MHQRKQNPNPEPIPGGTPPDPYTWVRFAGGLPPAPPWLCETSTSRKDRMLPIASSEASPGGLGACPLSPENYSWVRFAGGQPPAPPWLCEASTSRKLNITHNLERSEPRGSGGVPPETNSGLGL
ncbi:hypothetical protein TRICI_006880 [Trichomonascus ciferrii]|uniref:Uncharacterized protein n=1 Tax=Trichomonascus ciferrii TaxID=44093 RepID=A0A6A1LJN2_9ASCO|nr:hypothetical protein TRICI_006880 [Trichomonascus ciferrii]